MATTTRHYHIAGVGGVGMSALAQALRWSGARVTGSGLACKIVDTFLNTGFDGSYHADRVALISDIERRERA